MRTYRFIGKTVYFPKEKILVIGDLHFGYEEELNREGVAVPRRMVGEVIKDLEKIVEKVKKVEKIVVLGDLRHSFGEILKEEKKDIKRFLDFLDKRFNGKEVIVTKGNHDTMLKIILRSEGWKNIRPVDYFLDNGILFFHGDCRSFEKIEKIKKGVKLCVVGHFHPAIDVTDGEKVERFKCFLVGKLNRKEIIFVPSFFPLVDGANILGDCELNLLPIKERQVFVVSPDGDVLDFGKIK
jgi:uncharacterized protein